ncbi:MAG TPA: hypothetical protein DCF33_08865, partial [Saprospirales bacterium]|nr:hypothetical protein [Saprospirales bacterium]
PKFPNMLLDDLAQIGSNISNLNSSAEYIIPVVVHVIHSGGQENISDQQIFRALEILNAGFRGDYDPDHLDTKIRFQLAQNDPNGCPTNGIVRTYKEVEPCIYTGYVAPPNQGVYAHTIIAWPKRQYLNIYVVNCFDLGFVIGLTDYPTTNDPSDGIVMNHRYFGDIGTASNSGDNSLTINHEAGHAFGLIHIWGPDLGFATPTWFNCHLESQGETNGDFVSDTPPQGDTGGSPCIPPDNSCEIEFPDRVDDMDNFMSYSRCQAAFTVGQNDKFIQWYLNNAYNTLWSPINQDCSGVQPSFPSKTLEVTQNTVFSTSNLPNGGEITMDKIIVKSGNTLTIEPGVVIHFTRCTESNLIVEPNAKLILHGKLTNSVCSPGTRWHGVEVAGVNIFQGIFNTPGEVFTMDGAIIENADFGIRNKANINGITYSGGKLICHGSIFKNNRVGVRFYHWFDIDKPHPGPWSFPEDNSEFEDCLFTYTFNSNLKDALQAHMYLEGVKGIEIKNSIFENQTQFGIPWTKKWNVGIYAVDGGFNIDGDGSSTTVDFKGLTYGIYTIATGSGQPFTVKNCAFYGNAVGIYNRGVSNATITFNTFDYLHDLQTFQELPDQIGIYLEGLMTMIDIQENNFSDASAGILPNINTIGICSNSTGGFNNAIRRNTFDHVTVGNIANGVNSDAQSGGLTYRCNTNLGLLAYDIALTDGASIRPVQDGPPQQNQPFSSAGNKFAYFNILLEDDITSAGAPFTYRYHLPTPNDEPKEVTIGKVFKVNVQQANSCGPEHQLESPDPREQWIISFQSEKTAWQSAHQQYLTALDGGNTSARVALVANATTATISSVMGVLLMDAPWVSERVFRTLIGKYPMVSALQIKNLLLQNPDVLSDGGFWIFLKNSNLFSETEMQVFSNATTTVTLRTPIQQNMASHKVEMDYWGSLYLNDYLHEHPDYTTSFYQTFMQGFAGYQTDALIVEELLRNGNLTQALSLVNSMGTVYCSTSEEISQHAQYQQLVQVMVNAFLDNRSLYEFNSTELGQIEAIHQTSSGLANLLSGNILHSFGVITLPYAPCMLPDGLPDFQGGGTENRTDTYPSQSTDPSKVSVLCYPNPAGDFVQFDLSQLPAEVRCGQISIYDLMGKMIAQKPLATTTENVIVDTRNVPDGIYLFRVTCGQNQIYAGKFIVKKP